MHHQSRLALAVLAAALPLAAQQKAGVGEQVPDFQVLNNGADDGRTRLAQFYGEVVVIDFWGTR